MRPRLITLRQQLGMTHLDGAGFEILGNIVKVLGRLAQRVSDIDLMHHGGQPPRVPGLFAVVFRRVHTLSTRSLLLSIREPFLSFNGRREGKERAINKTGAVYAQGFRLCAGAFGPLPEAPPAQRATPCAWRAWNRALAVDRAL